jgi:predicted nucleic acid-binding protein
MRIVVDTNIAFSAILNTNSNIARTYELLELSLKK